MFDAVLAFLNNTVVLTLIGLGAGWLFKRHPDFPNKAIPLMNGVIALLIKLGDAAFGPGVVHGEPAAFLVAAGGPSFFAVLWQSVWQAALQAALTTGVHSASKNTIEGLRGR